MTDFSAADTVSLLCPQGQKITIQGLASRVWNHARPISDTDLSSLSFIRGTSVVTDAELKLLRGVVLVPIQFMRNRPDLAFSKEEVTFIETEEPEAAFFLALNQFLVRRAKSEIHPSSVIEESSEIAGDVAIGPLTYIGSSVVLGQGVRIGAGCTLRNCSIGDFTVIQDGVRIGGDALGVVKDGKGEWIDRPSLSRVVIGERSRIEDNTVIQCGFMQDTHVAENVRIGPNSCIGNGVSVGAGSLIAQGVVIAGSVSIGINTRLWGNSSVREGVKIGDNTVIGMGSVVLVSLPANGLYVGNPAKLLDR